mmetsp:Transcript_17244/g.21184  ORF Transcript_17244/g.21184 Transcript_17244/m.21184 type:complete len:281 (-) Transcript_17244:361-1203(-)
MGGPPSSSSSSGGVKPIELDEPIIGASGSVVRLYLCRHGQTDYNAQGLIQGSGIDRPLSSTGLVQAEAVASALRELPLYLIGSSSLTRSVQTADAVARYHPNVNRIEHKGLREMSFGDLEGKKVVANSEVYTQVQTAWANGDYELRWPGSNGESPNDLLKRAHSALKDLGILDLNTDHGIRHIALIAHGRFNKILLSSLLADYGIKRCGDIIQDNCCINILDIDPAFVPPPLFSTNAKEEEKGRRTIHEKERAITAIKLNYIDHLRGLNDPEQPPPSKKK